MNADPVVMEFFPSTLTRAETDDFVDRIEAHFEEHGWGLWAVEVPGIAEFVGYVGLWPAPAAVPFAPAVEVGWRLTAAHWGKGYAPEGARAVVADGFDRLGLTDIVSFTAAVNLRSQRVMEKLGMQRDPADDFDHPAVPVDSHLRRHVLFRLQRPQSR